MLALDHATLSVPDHAGACALLEEVTGLAPVHTPGHAGHARLMLDRSYLEIRAGSGPAWSIPGFFFGYRDRSATAAFLRERGISFQGPSEYQGVDGVWEELILEGPAAAQVPIAVRRLLPAAIAADWPPPLRDAGPLGMLRLDAVVISSALPAVRSFWSAFGPTDALTLPDGGRVLLEPGDGGLTGMVFGCESLARVEGRLRDLKRSCRRAGEVLWLEPALTPGIRLGFAEAAR